MREILFRGKRMENGEWVQGDLLQNVDCLKIREQEKDVKHIAKSFEVVPDAVGQYTGLTDKNGEKIFEGDILQFTYTGDNEGVEGIASVVFERGKFGVLWGWHKELVCLDGFANTTVEVIGNTHDNPELLGGE
jgi:uncharacterized phage protein (TIGR01671 family)